MECSDGPVGPVVLGKRYWPEAEEGTDWYIEADRTKDGCGQVDFGFSFNSFHDAVTEQPVTLGTTLMMEEGLEAAVSPGPHGWCGCCLTVGVHCSVSTTQPKHTCSAHPESPSPASPVSCQLLSLLCFRKCGIVSRKPLTGITTTTELTRGLGTVGPDVCFSDRDQQPLGKKLVARFLPF